MSRSSAAGTPGGRMRILVLGAGVIGSVYAGRLLQAGHHVVLLARGQWLADLRAHGLVLQDARSGHQTRLPVSAVAAGAWLFTVASYSAGQTGADAASRPARHHPPLAGAFDRSAAPSSRPG